MKYLFVTLLLVWMLLQSACSMMESSRIEKAVLDALDADAKLGQYTFDVSYQDDGKVLITGTVYAPEEIDLVTTVAEAVEGVAGVLNRVAVEEHDSGMLQDEVVVTPYL